MTRTFSKESGLPLMWNEFFRRFNTVETPVTVQFIAEKGYYLSSHSHEERIYCAARWLMYRIMMGAYPLEYIEYGYIGTVAMAILFAASNADRQLIIAIHLNEDFLLISLEFVSDDHAGQS